MVYRLPVLPPELAVAEGWTPKETFSPTSMTTYASPDGCKRKWAWGACFGVWGVRKNLAQLLGSLIHGSIEQYLKGGKIYDLVGPEEVPGQPLLHRLRLDERTLKEFTSLEPEKLEELVDQAPKRALAGLHLLPDTQDPAVEKIEVEQWIKVDTRRVISGIEPIRITGKTDLVIRRAGVWYLYDHKSTKGRPREPWCYVKTPEDLKNDPQAVFYALDVMLKHGLQSLWIRWIYYLTDTKAHPLAKAVDVELRLEDVMRAAHGWLIVANEMRAWVRLAAQGQLSPYDVPANENACEAYGGCNYSYTKGGPCMPAGEVQLGSIISTGKPPEKANMSVSNLAQQLQNTMAQLPPGAQPPMVPPNPFTPPEAHGAVPTAAAVTAAPALPQLPAGWEYGPDSRPRPVASPGWAYDANGVLQLVPVPPVAPPPVAPPPLPAAAPAAVVPVAATATAPAPDVVPVPPQTAAEPKRRGRKAGSKNQPKAGDAGAADDAGAYDLLVQAAHDADDASPLRTLTVAQLIAVAAVLDAA